MPQRALVVVDFPFSRNVMAIHVKKNQIQHVTFQIREFGYLARRVREIHDEQPPARPPPRTLYALIGTAIGYIWPDEREEEQRAEREDEVGGAWIFFIILKNAKIL